MLVAFWSLSLIEHAHPLEGGYFRRKVRTERRPTMTIVPAWRFWPAYAADMVVKHTKVAIMVLRLIRVRRNLKADPAAREYRDLALTPVENETATLDLLTVTDAARTAARHPMRAISVPG
jgi:hypothetical protein